MPDGRSRSAKDSIPMFSYFQCKVMEISLISCVRFYVHIATDCFKVIPHHHLQRLKNVNISGCLILWLDLMNPQMSIIYAMQ
jgi:hypothetical protein